jgi:hypothetical protein
MPDGDPRSGEACAPGQEVRVDGAVKLAGSTESYADSLRAGGCVRLPDTSNGPDRVYALAPSRSGKLTVQLESAAFKAAVYLRADYCTSADAMCFTGTGGAASAWVQAGRTYYLIVDGASSAAKGQFEIAVTLQ